MTVGNAQNFMKPKRSYIFSPNEIVLALTKSEVTVKGESPPAVPPSGTQTEQHTTYSLHFCAAHVYFSFPTVNNEAVQTWQVAVRTVTGAGAVSAKYVTRLSRPLKQGSAHGMINPIPRSSITGITSFLFPSSLRVHIARPPYVKPEESIQQQKETR